MLARNGHWQAGQQPAGTLGVRLGVQAHTGERQGNGLWLGACWRQVHQGLGKSKSMLKAAWSWAVFLRQYIRMC